MTIQPCLKLTSGSHCPEHLDDEVRAMVAAIIGNARAHLYTTARATQRSVGEASWCQHRQVDGAVGTGRWTMVLCGLHYYYQSRLDYKMAIYIYISMCIYRYIYIYIVTPLYLTTSTDRPLPYMDHLTSVANDRPYRYFNSLSQPPP